MNYTNIFNVESKEKNLFGKTGLVYSAFDRSGNKVPAKFIPTSLRKEAFTTNKKLWELIFNTMISSYYIDRGWTEKVTITKSKIQSLALDYILKK